MEDDWADDTTAIRDSEWAKISSDFQNAGYREGITAGKEGALQEGFDEGYAETGVPIGREIGNLRGISSALVSLLSSPTFVPEHGDREQFLQEARLISMELAELRFSDVAPPDLQAEQHAREHLESADVDDRDFDVEMNEEVKQKRDVEGLEDLMTRMGAVDRLKSLAGSLGIPLPLP
ncbi:unnamed protein product [Somion occarium]|uniref:Protein YAE1 n=1 Tax=Somion occarium TaxID=3059160 RepID=A0ABP1DQK5_9APHY